MIHYNRIKVGQVLVVGGMVPVPRRRDGEVELQAPPLENGSQVKVVKVGVDFVTVADAAGKQVTLSHGTGAQKLTPAGKPQGEPESALAREARELSQQPPNPADAELLKQRQQQAERENPQMPNDTGQFKLPGTDE